MGGPDEQLQGSGGGSGDEGAGVRLNEPLPTEEEQRQAIEEAEDEQSSAFAISQEDIDAVLLHGSGIADGKFRIYERFEAEQNSGENASFLKEEYKSTIYFSVITDKKVGAWRDTSGIKISIGELTHPKAEVRLTWKKAAKRIGELMAVDRYLSPAEKEQYQEYRRQRDTPTVQPEPTYDELNPSPQPKKEYRFALGDTVHLGAQEYQLLAFDEQTVRLFDPAFPIINKELPRNEFDRLLAENPLNDHLLQVAETVPQVTTPGYDLGYAHMGNGLTVWNSLEEEHGDYKTIAHIAPDRTVTFYVDNLPEDVRARIEHIAATSEAKISATQDTPVFSTPPILREPSSGRFWDDYNSIKEHNPDSLVLYQVGDFFELYGDLDGEDGRNAANILNLTLTTRNIPDIGRVPMCGFPVRVLDSYTARLNQAGFDVIVARLDGNRHKTRHIPATAPGPQYEIRDIPYIFCEWSESAAFQGKTAYSISEFDRLMKQTDDEYSSKKAAAMAKYGTWQKWYDADDPEFQAYLSYDKVKFTIVLPDGRAFTERQDIGDGDGGVLDFLSKLSDYREIVPLLREAAQQEAETPQETPKAQQKTDDFSDIDPAAIRAALAERGIVDGQVVDPAKLDADPFIQQVMADVEQIAAEELPPYERFSLIETDNGYAVWDNARNEIYTDSEGVQEEFTSEWQAEDYLKKVVKDVADKESAEWLAMERAKQGLPPQEPAEQEEKPGVEKVASYQTDDERIVIFRYPNGKYYNHYGYDEQRGFGNTTAGGFDTFEEAEKTLYSHRPKAEKILEPAEKTAESEKSAESLAKGHGQGDDTPAPAPPTPRRRARVSPFVLHPEVPNADRHEYQITDDAIGVGTPGTRFNNNIRAIRLLKKLEREDRFATPEEQAVLAQYVGWGGLADCFDERHSKYAELKALLTEDEYTAARESTLTAFYTPPVVIRSIYQALENMGFKTGNLLEPSCG
ncbi:LPD25 domain-containing protein, partial [uncultured Oscillibacter sp.]|uniref:LPD25 domain-containing protein n=1 Tax=uncultured Oscillibacter sp. TaxID=876091 RepID=UPI00345A3644